MNFNNGKMKLMEHDLIFWLGDLNYRLDTGLEEYKQEEWPIIIWEQIRNDKLEKIRENIKENNLENLLEKDQVYFWEIFILINLDILLAN